MLWPSSPCAAPARPGSRDSFLPRVFAGVAFGGRQPRPRQSNPARFDICRAVADDVAEPDLGDPNQKLENSMIDKMVTSLLAGFSLCCPGVAAAQAQTPSPPLYGPNVTNEQAHKLVGGAKAGLDAFAK